MTLNMICGILLIFVALCYAQSLRNLHKAKKELDEYGIVIAPIKDLMVSNDYDVEDMYSLVKLGIIKDKGFVVSHMEDSE